MSNSVGERRPLHQLHHQRTDAIGLFQAVDDGNVRVIQRRQRLGFALEAGQPIGIVRKGVGEDFDRDLATKVSVGGALDLAHAAHSDLGGDFIRAEAGAGSQSHGKWLRL